MDEADVKLLELLTAQYLESNELIDYQALQHYFPSHSIEELQYQLLKLHRKKHKRQMVYRWQRFDTQILVHGVQRYQRNWRYINDTLFKWMDIRELKNRYYQVVSNGQLMHYVYQHCDRVEEQVGMEEVLECVKKYIE